MNILAVQAQGGMPAMGWMIQLVLIVGIIYFMIIMPQRKERQRHAEMLSSLKAGDEVVTAGGLMGEIITLREDSVTLKTGDARVLVERARVVRKITPPATA